MSMLRSLAACSGSLVVSMVPKGVSTFTLSPFWLTRALLATRYPMMPTVATPRIPMRTMAPTTTRTILRALPPPPLEGVTGGGGVITGGAAATGAPDTAAPHLLQNFVPSARDAPQKLQNAICHLRCGIRSTREYIAVGKVS